MIRFLITGDIQAHKWRQFAHVTKSGMNSRLANCLKVFRLCRKEALKRGINKLLLNGDILEESDYIDIEIFNGVYNELEKISDDGIETAINLGNHDVHKEVAGRVLHALRAFRKVARVIESPTLLWGKVYVVPWMPDSSSIVDAITAVKEPSDKCLVLHCGVQGATTGPKAYLVRNPIKLRDIRASEFSVTLLSDYHTRQYLQKSPPVLYMGSPLQHTFGEIHRPCIWSVCLGGGGVRPRLDKIYTGLPRFRRVTASTAREFREQTIGFANDYVKVRAASDELSDRSIEHVAREIGFQVSIERAKKEVEDIQDVRSVNFQSAMENYVRNNAKSNAEKLLKLGWRIFNGEA